MATVILAGVGYAIGSTTGIAGATTLGYIIGTLAGTIIDQVLDPFKLKGEQISQDSVSYGNRYTSGIIQTSSYGAVIPKIAGAMQVPGNVIWARELVEIPTAEYADGTAGGKGGGSGGGTSVIISYYYYADFATALGEGPLELLEIWCDGKKCYDADNVVTPWVQQSGLSVIIDQQTNPVLYGFIGSSNWILMGLLIGDQIIMSGFANDANNTTVTISHFDATGTIFYALGPYVEESAAGISIETVRTYQSNPTNWPGGSSDFEQYFEFYSGTETQEPDPDIETIEGAGNVPAYRGLSYIKFNQLPLKEFGPRIPSVTAVVRRTVTVPDFVEEVFLASGLEAGEYDLTDLAADEIGGLVLNQQASGQTILGHLQFAHSFDLAEVGGQVIAVPYKTSADVVMDDDDLGAGDVDAQVDRVKKTVAGEIDIPRQIDLRYVDPDNFETVAVRSRRETVPHARIQTIDLPIVATDVQAQGLVDYELRRQWVARRGYEITVPDKYSYLVPSDVIQLPAVRGGHLAKITKIDASPNGQLKITCEQIWQETIPVAPGGAGSGWTGTPAAGVDPAALLLLDIPPLREEDLGIGLYVAAYTPEDDKPMTVYRSVDGGVSYSTLATVSKGTVIGYVTSALTSGLSQNRWDRTSVVRVNLSYSGHALGSASELAVYNGANECLIGDEIVRYQTATYISAGVYDLSVFLRGRRNTGHEMDNHAVNDRFVLLKDIGTRIVRVADTLNNLRVSYSYKGVSGLQTLNDTPPQSYINYGYGYYFPSPVHLYGYNDDGYWQFFWTRRERQNYQWENYRDIPADAEGESYYIWAVYGGITLLSTAVTTPYASVSASSVFLTLGFTPDYLDVTVERRSLINSYIYQANKITGRIYG